MKRLILPLLILLAAGLACGITPAEETIPTDTPPASAPLPTVIPSKTPIPTDTLTPEATEAFALPDLTSSNSIIARGFDGTCLDGDDHLVIDYEFCVENIGQGDAGPFAVISDDWIHEFDGLAAGARECVMVTLYKEINYPFAYVDARNEVEESDESNNRGVFNLTPTPPPRCTPTDD
jgi:hypothetical protein